MSMMRRGVTKSEFLQSNREYSELYPEDDTGDRRQEAGPSKEHLEYARRKEQLNELIRKKQKNKGSGTARVEFEDEEDDYESDGYESEETEYQRRRQSSDHGSKGQSGAAKPKPLFGASYGNMFGPSKPVVAKRIVDEAREKEAAAEYAKKAAERAEVERKQREEQAFADRIAAEKYAAAAKSQASNAYSSRTKYEPKPAEKVDQKVVKVQKLRENRDYSFLFSEDAQPSTSGRAPNSQPGTNGKHSDPKHANVNRENGTSKPPPPRNGHSQSKHDQPKGSGSKAPPPRSSSSDRPRSDNNRPDTNHKQRHPETHKHERQRENHHMHERPENHRRPSPSLGTGKANGGSTKAPAPHDRQRDPSGGKLGTSSKPPPSSGHPQRPPLGAKPQLGETKRAGEPRPKLAAGSGSDPRLARDKLGRADAHGSVRRDVASSSKAGAHGGGNGRLLEERGSSGNKHTVKKPGSSSAVDHRRQADERRPKPPKHVERPPKRKHRNACDDEDDEEDGGGGDYRSMIRAMFGYNPDKFKDEDDDDINMEADFRSIEAEEKRSARLAREEDEREERALEEEDRRRQERKKRKMLEKKAKDG